MLDWIDSALVDHGVPVALVSTPQFHRDLGALERTTGYSAGQFLRRFAGRWKPLPETTERADLLAIAAREMPRVGAGLRAKAVDYAIKAGRDVSGLGDVIKEARSMRESARHAARRLGSIPGPKRLQAEGVAVGVDKVRQLVGHFAACGVWLTPRGEIGTFFPARRGRSFTRSRGGCQQGCRASEARD